MLENTWETTDEKFNDEKVLDIWNFRGTQKLIDEEKFFIDALSMQDLKIEREPFLTEKPFSNRDRQYFQCFGIRTFKNEEGYILNSDYIKMKCKNGNILLTSLTLKQLLQQFHHLKD